MEIKAPFDYKAEARRFKEAVLDPLVAQYIRDNPGTTLPEIAKRFGITGASIWTITTRQGLRRGSGRRKKAL